MILGFPYQGAKTLLILVTIILLICQMMSADYFSIKAGTTKGDSTKQISVGLNVTDLTPTLNINDPAKMLIKNQIALGCMGPVNTSSQPMLGPMIGEDVISDCRDLCTLETMHKMILILLVLTIIPKYGEAAGIIAALLIVVATAGTFYKYMNKRKDRLAEARENTPLSSTEDNCVPGICIYSEMGESYILNIFLMILGFVILGQSGYGIFSMFMC